MLMPKRVKYRKQFRGRRRGMAKGGSTLLIGEYGLQALEAGWVTSRQIEAIRRSIVRQMRRRGKYWVRIFPDKPVTAKPAETRMGKGKGSVDHWVAVVKPGRVIFEIADVPTDIALQALRSAGYKLPIKTQVISREEAL
ncbi:MAG: 50S ribosomal protein L16 [Candidatus Promineofilum sp.]|jgi:large subunit ribosomal protein L16|nr:50S ribosomal protein L16 [Promineifilum sp.]